jgi:putative ABC transport system permease protein
MSRFFDDLIFRLRALLRRRDADRDLHDELAFHLAMETNALRRAGRSAADAEREARLEFGPMAGEAERAREGWGLTPLVELLADARHGLRQMRRRPGFSTLVVLSLGLGIGVTVALVSIVDSLVLRPLPYAHEQQVNVFWLDYTWTAEEHDFLARRLGVFDRMAAFSTDGSTYAVSTHASGASSLLSTVVSTPSLFDVLGVRPMLGRTYEANDDRPGAPPVVVVSYGLWRQDLAGDPKVIGRQIVLDGKPVTVIGVMPDGFYFPSPEQRAWRPLQLDPTSKGYKDAYLVLIARARANATSAQVTGEMQRLAKALATRFSYPAAWDHTKNPAAIPVHTYLLGSVREPLLLLLGAIGLLFLIACANAAALVLARTSDRSAEMAVRAALGAGSSRLARQILAESLVLALCAATAGSALAALGFRLFVARLPLRGGIGDALTIGWVAFAAALVLSLVITVVVSAAPLRNLLRGGFRHSLSGERSAGGLRHGTRRVHGAIIGAQVTFAMLLLVCAALLIRTVERIGSIDPGFDARGVTTYSILLSGGIEDETRAQLLRVVLDRVSALPGVITAGMTNRLPVRDLGYQTTFGAEGHPDLVGDKRPTALYRTASPRYFATMGMRIVEGRGIDSTDVASGTPVAVVNESFARAMWPGAGAVGKHVTEGWSGKSVLRTVVGVARDARLVGLLRPPPITLWLPFAQNAPAQYGAVLTVRSTLPAAATMQSVRAAVGELGSQVAIARAQSMSDAVSSSLGAQLRLRFFFSIFAAFALVLAATGVYGVVSYAVTRRRSEYAVRMALGASPRTVFQQVLRFGLAPVLVGVVLGALGAAGAGRLVSSMLYAVTPTDLASFALAAATLLGAGAAAAFLPAIRAGRASPAEALRADST